MASAERRFAPPRRSVPAHRVLNPIRRVQPGHAFKKRAHGAFGDPAGYEETLYKTPDGKFFLYAFGGAESPFTAETIKRMSAAKADEWLAAEKA